MAAVQLANVRYPHEAIIDEILIDPSVSQAELAARFKYSQTWMSIIMNSDAFKQRLAERKVELIDPKITASIEDRLNAVAKRSLDRIMERLDSSASLIKDADLIGMAKLGVGDLNARGPKAPTQQNLYVVNIPSPAPNSVEWLKTSQGGPMTSAPDIIENGNSQ